VSASTPNGETRDLERLYAKSLEGYLGGHGEEALRNAYEIGRTAIGRGLSVLDVAAMHHDALAGLLPRTIAPASLKQNLERANEFFAESVSPYEMARRGFQDAVSALRRVNETLEQEIQRMAHVVHDEAGQLLVAARLAMSGLAHDLGPSVESRVHEVAAILDQAEEQLRGLSHELRPRILDDLGLVPALRFLADRVSKRSELSIRVESSPEARYASNVETALYRIVQEALTNVAKHGQARHVRVQITHTRKNLHCVVADDGVGFDVPAVLSRAGHDGLGLVGIRERLSAVGGTLGIESKPGHGTSLQIKIPMES
jgi:signal transduction histidine kinase